MKTLILLSTALLLTACSNHSERVEQFELIKESSQVFCGSDLENIDYKETSSKIVISCKDKTFNISK